MASGCQRENQRATELPERARAKTNPENDKVMIKGEFLYLSRSLDFFFFFFYTLPFKYLFLMLDFPSSSTFTFSFSLSLNSPPDNLISYSFGIYYPHTFVWINAGWTGKKQMIRAVLFYVKVIHRPHIYFFFRFSRIFSRVAPLTVPPCGSLSSLLETSVPWSRCALRSLFTPTWWW